MRLKFNMNYFDYCKFDILSLYRLIGSKRRIKRRIKRLKFKVCIFEEVNGKFRIRLIKRTARMRNK